jgi:hypothetical protein
MLGYGITALVINFLRGVCLMAFSSSDSRANEFTGVLVYYIVSSIFLIISASMYYIERKNRFM